MSNDVMTFEEILADKAYQSEFDKRVTKALDTAKTKWDTEAAEREADIFTSLGIKSKEEIPALLEKLNAGQAGLKEQDKLLRRLEALEATSKQAHAELNARKQLELLRGAKIPEEQLDFYQFKINKLVTDALSFEDAAAQYIKDNPPQVKPPEFATGAGKPMATATEKEQLLNEYKAAQKNKNHTEMSRLTRLAHQKGVQLF